MVDESAGGQVTPDSGPPPWARLGLIALALAFSTHGYLLHRRQLPDWWVWAGEFILASALFTIALRDQAAPRESAVRCWLRRALGVAALAFLGGAILYGRQPGSELPAGIATAAAVVSFLLSRWVPISARDALCLNGGESDARRAGVLAWLATAVGLALAVAAAVVNRSEHLTGALLWLAGLLVVGVAMQRFGKAIPPTAPSPWQLEGGPLLKRGSEALAVLLILLLATALRVPFLDRVPAYINSDEGRLHRYALSLYQQGFPDLFALGWNAFPHISVLADVVPIQILGMGIDNLRLASAIFGLASLLATYFWARRWWGNVVAVLTMLILTINQEHINWSRTGMNNIQQILVGALMLATFARALQRRQPLDWLLFGYATGFAFLTYHAAKLFPALLFAFAVVYAIGIRGFARRNLLGGVIALIGFLVVLGPHLVTIYVDWFNFYQNTSNRVDLAVLLDAYHAGNVGGVRNYLNSHVLATVQLFTLNDLPFLDPFLFIVALPGIGWMFWRWRDPRHTAALGWLGGILVIGGMITAYPPNVPRLIGVLPIACLVPALVIGRIRVWCHRTAPGRADFVFVPAAVLCLSASFYWNWQTEFVVRTWMQGNDAMTHVCKTIGRTPLPTTAYTVGGLGEVDAGIAPIDCMMPLDVDRQTVGLTDDPSLFPMRPSNHGTALFIFTKQQFELLPLLQHYYPGASYASILTRDGLPNLWTATLSPAVIDRERGLRLTWTRGGYAEESANGSDTLHCSWCTAFPAQVTGRGLVYIAKPGGYGFRAAGATMRLNGREVGPEDTIDLAAGWHALRAETEVTNGNEVALEWRTPDDPGWQRIPRAFLNTHPARHGLLGRYFTQSLPLDAPNPSAAEPAYVQIVPALSFDANPERDEVPPPGFASKGATMEWTGTVELSEGETQTLRLNSTSPTRVFLDGVEVLSTPGGTPPTPVEATLAGLHGRVPILVRTVREPDPQVWYWWLRLLWRQPGGDWAAFVDYQPPED